MTQGRNIGSLNATLGALNRRTVLGEAETKQPDYTETVQKALPILTSILDKSAAEDVEVLKAKITNAQSWADRLPGPTGDVFRNRVRTLKAKLRAAKAKAKIEAETLQSDREWRVLGKGVGVTVAVAGVATTILLLSGARYLSRKS